MSKALDEPVQMLGAEHLQPGSKFLWRDREHEIESVGGQWRQCGRWWIGEGSRRYFRITTLSNLTADLYLDETAHTWTLAAIWD